MRQDQVEVPASRDQSLMRLSREVVKSKGGEDADVEGEKDMDVMRES